MPSSCLDVSGCPEPIPCRDRRLITVGLSIRLFLLDCLRSSVQQTPNHQNGVVFEISTSNNRAEDKVWRCFSNQIAWLILDC